jgi:alcohol dehydrogenase (cytochrome c)
MSRIRLAIWVVLLSAVASATATWFVPAMRWRATLVWLKARRSLTDITWGELVRLGLPGAPYYLVRLVDSPNPYSVIKNPFPLKSDAEEGRRMFLSLCASCHGADGSGAAGGPSLFGRQLRLGDSDWAIFRTISHGVPGTAMPASSLPDRNVWQLAAHVRTLMAHSTAETEASVIQKMPPLAPVSYQDLLHAHELPDRWIVHSGSYDSHRFSTASQITPANVAGLRLMWMRQCQSRETRLETTPLAVGDYMFLTVSPNDVEALDIRTGALIWSYKRAVPEQLSLCCGYQNRGLAILGNRLFLGTLDAHLVALDTRTGQVAWDREIADYKAGYSITSAPLALKNLVVTGVAGGEFGIRGFLEAHDADTGKLVWKFYTIPEPGQTGAESWQAGSWRTGGGPTWLTGSYDPKLNLIYWPVGNPAPEFSGNGRSGDNLYTNSVVALDADQGTLKWYFQFTPHDEFDWDATENLVLLRAKVEGIERDLLAQANRNAFYYLLDRETGRFLSAAPFARQTWAERIDERGRPVMKPEARPTGKGTSLYPAVDGATNWQSPSYNPEAQAMYVPVMERGGLYFSANVKYDAGKLFLGGMWQPHSNESPWLAVRALNALTGVMKWEYRTAGRHMGGLLSTAGGVVFGSHEQWFFALDASTGQELWRLNTGGPIAAAPITFLHAGRQLVVVAAGNNILAFHL